MTHWLLLLLTVILTAVANLLLKYAAVNRDELAGAKGIVDSLWELFTTPSLILGIFCLGVAMVAYAIALRYINLSVAYPVMTTSVVVLVAIFSAIYFGEPFTLVKVAGTVMVISGVILLSQ
ncbi:MAG: EamA family transporter [Gammaproteobacteria bacterium]|nr:EamA family transporter [Gammaproteobacteria bacterium]MBU1775252.1 EamA family transporter [Gammaproteobacteria bacterium]MBU1969726.1 EamA family transporter [Gammaproteobacteria bacterium]